MTVIRCTSCHHCSLLIRNADEFLNIDEASVSFDDPSIVSKQVDGILGVTVYNDGMKQVKTIANGKTKYMLPLPGQEYEIVTEDGSESVLDEYDESDIELLSSECGTCKYAYDEFEDAHRRL